MKSSDYIRVIFFQICYLLIVDLTVELRQLCNNNFLYNRAFTTEYNYLVLSLWDFMFLKYLVICDFWFNIDREYDAYPTDHKTFFQVFKSMRIFVWVYIHADN